MAGSSSSSSWVSLLSSDGGWPLPCYLVQERGYLFLLEGGNGALWLEECGYSTATKSSSSGSSPSSVSTGSSNSKNEASDSRSSLTRGYLYWGGKRRDTAYVEATLDLSARDVWVVQHSGPLQVQLGGTFQGVKIPYEIVACVDGTTLRVCLGKLPAGTAQAVGKAWYEAMVMRVRALLTIARRVSPPWPGTPFEVI